MPKEIKCPRCDSTNTEVYLKSGSNKFIRCKDCKWTWKERIQEEEGEE